MLEEWAKGCIHRPFNWVESSLQVVLGCRISSSSASPSWAPMASFSISTSLFPSHSLSKRSPLSPAYSRPWVPSHPRLNSSTWRFRPPKLNARLENKPGDPPSSTPREAQSLSDKQLQVLRLPFASKFSQFWFVSVNLWALCLVAEKMEESGMLKMMKIWDSGFCYFVLFFASSHQQDGVKFTSVSWSLQLIAGTCLVGWLMKWV